MHISLMQTCNTEIDEQVNTVCVMQNFTSTCWLLHTFGKVG